MTVAAIRDAVTVTVPAATIQIPPVTALLPTVWSINVAASFAHPNPAYPKMFVAPPIPITWHPDMPSAWRGDNFIAKRWWAHSYRYAYRR